MKTKNATYIPDLDVLRALAAIMVFFWHYLHVKTLLAEEIYLPGISLLEEGHVGVSLFMVLSGYLFFKITFNKEVEWNKFAWNRVKRIAPLLVVIQIFWLALGFLGHVPYTLLDFIQGFITPSWPSVLWSITVELHLCMLLPLLLWMVKRDENRLLIFFGILFFANLWIFSGLSPAIRYYTVLGRLDQFILGALCLVYWHRIPAAVGAICFILFLIYIEVFNAGGGHALFNKGTNAYFSSSFSRYSVEGVGFAGLMVWILKTNFSFKNGWLWSFLAWVGTVSYSFYMLHYFVWRGWSLLLEKLEWPMWVQLLSIIPAFALTLLVSWVSYNFIERPFLKLRGKYVA